MWWKVQNSSHHSCIILITFKNNWFQIIVDFLYRSIICTVMNRIWSKSSFTIIMNVCRWKLNQSGKICVTKHFCLQVSSPGTLDDISIINVVVMNFLFCVKTSCDLKMVQLNGLMCSNHSVCEHEKAPLNFQFHLCFSKTEVTRGWSLSWLTRKDNVC